MKVVILILHAFRDLIIRYLPNFKKNEYAFAFLVHPRNIEDTYRKYPFFSFFPQKFLLWFLRHYWPVVISRVTGLKSLKTGKEIKGYIIAIPLTAHQMLEDRTLAKKKIIQAINLAEKLGTKIVGLGALISSVTRGGLDLIDKVNINITTGHAYTAYTITSNLFKLIDVLNADKKEIIIAIVGATGSVGSTSAQIIARAGYKNLLLIDLERKTYLFENLINQLKNLNKNINIEISHQIQTIKKSNFIISATNAPEAVIRADDLKSGAVIIDDAQPSDVSPEVLEREDVLVVEGGVVYTEGINNHFNFGLKHKMDNFCCLAEVLILATQEWKEHYVIERANLKLVDEISELGHKINFRLAEFQNAKEIISNKKLALIKDIIQNNKNVI